MQRQDKTNINYLSTEPKQNSIHQKNVANIDALAIKPVKQNLTTANLSLSLRRVQTMPGSFKPNIPSDTSSNSSEEFMLTDDEKGSPNTTEPIISPIEMETDKPLSITINETFYDKEKDFFANPHIKIILENLKNNLENSNLDLSSRYESAERTLFHVVNEYIKFISMIREQNSSAMTEKTKYHILEYGNNLNSGMEYISQNLNPQSYDLKASGHYNPRKNAKKARPLAIAAYAQQKNDEATIAIPFYNYYEHTIFYPICVGYVESVKPEVLVREVENYLKGGSPKIKIILGEFDDSCVPFKRFYQEKLSSHQQEKWLGQWKDACDKYFKSKDKTFTQEKLNNNTVQVIPHDEWIKTAEFKYATNVFYNQFVADPTFQELVVTNCSEFLIRKAKPNKKEFSPSRSPLNNVVNSEVESKLSPKSMLNEKKEVQDHFIAHALNKLTELEEKKEMNEEEEKKYKQLLRIVRDYNDEKNRNYPNNPVTLFAQNATNNVNRSPSVSPQPVLKN